MPLILSSAWVLCAYAVTHFAIANAAPVNGRPGPDKGLTFVAVLVNAAGLILVLSILWS